MSRGAALLLLAACNVLGGLSYTWQGLAMRPAPDVAGLPPITLIVLRNLVALPLLAAWVRARGGRLSWTAQPRARRRVLLVAVLSFAAPLVLGVVGMRWSTTQNGSILILLEPASILVFARLLLGERILPVQALGVACGLAGAFTLVLEQVPAAGILAGLSAGEHLLGNVVLALHGVLWGTYTPLVKPLAERHDPAEVTLAILIGSLVVLVPSALFEARAWPTDPGVLADVLVWVLVLGVLVSFATTAGWTIALRELRASSIAPFVFLQPLAGVIGGALWMDESLSAHALVGGLLIGVGVLLVAVLGPRRAGRRV